jgi:hypothetical protein
VDEALFRRLWLKSVSPEDIAQIFQVEHSAVYKIRRRLKLPTQDIPEQEIRERARAIRAAKGEYTETESETLERLNREREDGTRTTGGDINI